MIILAPDWSPETENSLRYGFLVLSAEVMLRWELMVDNSGDFSFFQFLDPMSLCLKVSMKYSLCLKVSRNGIMVSQD